MSEVAEVVETAVDNSEIIRQLTEQDSNPLALNDSQKVRILTSQRAFLGIQSQLQNAATALNQTAIEIAAERNVDLKMYTLDLDNLRFTRRPGPTPQEICAAAGIPSA